jgi:hypothetical protein
VADNDTTIDVTTLREVQRLLASTDFASASDLAGRVGGSLAIDRRTATASAPVAAPTGDGCSSLPRRR